MEELAELQKKYGNNLADYISAKLTIAILEEEYWQKVNDAYFDQFITYNVFGYGQCDLIITKFNK